MQTLMNVVSPEGWYQLFWLALWALSFVALYVVVTRPIVAAIKGTRTHG